VSEVKIEISQERIGTVLHGALGDCHHQLCAIRKLKQANPNQKWIGFFAVANRLAAMEHFDLSMLDEIHLASSIPRVPVDRFHQFQVHDVELRQEVIDPLPETFKRKFDLRAHHKPWHAIREHDFSQSGLELPLSQKGRDYVPVCMEQNGIDPDVFKRKRVIGYLWRHRGVNGGREVYGQRSQSWIHRTKSELFQNLIRDLDAHLIVAGMKRDVGRVPDGVKHEAAFVEGEYRAKFADCELDICKDRVTYLKGLGFAAEMEIMSRCHLLLMMPSGFSEPLWMRRTVPVILMDPPPMYMARIWYNRMPLFDNRRPSYALYNSFIPHTAKNVIRFLGMQGLLN
jgi:hypothetical protein